MGEKEKVQSLWPPLCALLLAAGGSAFGTTVWGRGNAMGLLLALALGTAGFVMGLCLRKTARRRAVSGVAAVALLALCIGSSQYLVSDAYIVRKEWQTYSLGTATFAYPSLEWKKSAEDVAIPNGTLSTYTNENTQRYVCAFVYDFTGSGCPDLPDTMESAVDGMLRNFKAAFTEWQNVQETEDSVRARFAYERNGKPLTGLAFGAEDGGRYEIVMLFPLAKPCSEAFLSKLEESCAAN